MNGARCAHEFSLRSMNCKTLSCIVAYICTIMHCLTMQFMTALPSIHVCVANNSCPRSGQFIDCIAVNALCYSKVFDKKGLFQDGKAFYSMKNSGNARNPLDELQKK